MEGFLSRASSVSDSLALAAASACSGKQRSLGGMKSLRWMEGDLV